MPSGFVTRTKGKVSVGAIYPLQEVPTQIIKAGLAGQSTSIDPGGLTIVSSTLGAAVLTLGPPDVGTYKTITISTLSSGGLVVKTNSTGVTFFDGVNSYWGKGSSANVNPTLHLIAVSSVQWAVAGAYPPSTALFTTSS
jgi:hypothetical protein